MLVELLRLWQFRKYSEVLSRRQGVSQHSNLGAVWQPCKQANAMDNEAVEASKRLRALRAEMRTLRSG